LTGEGGELSGGKSTPASSRTDDRLVQVSLIRVISA
jgi:hypothetical protein